MVQWVLGNGMGLSTLIVLLGCTALMKANSPKHPFDVCNLLRLTRSNVNT